MVTRPSLQGFNSDFTHQYAMLRTIKIGQFLQKRKKRVVFVDLYKWIIVIETVAISTIQIKKSFDEFERFLNIQLFTFLQKNIVSICRPIHQFKILLIHLQNKVCIIFSNKKKQKRKKTNIEQHNTARNGT